MDVTDLLPHRAPFLMVDKILEVEPGKRAKALKLVSANEPHFQGHFPGYPVMPGVLIVEAIAQTAALAAFGNEPGMIGFLAGIDEARFRRPVRPGDILVIESEIISLKRSLGKARGHATVDGEVAAQATILFALRRTKDLPVSLP